MKLNKYELIIVVIGLICTGALIIYNAVSAPPLNTQVAYYTPSSVSETEETYVSEQSENTQAAVSVLDTSSAAEDSSIPEKAAKARETAVSDRQSDSSASPVSSQTDVTERLNINTATREQLMTLDGIGEVFAERIIDYREKNGRFLTTDELKLVEGIGDKRYEAIKDSVTVE